MLKMIISDQNDHTQKGRLVLSKSDSYALTFAKNQAKFYYKFRNLE